MKNLRPLFLFFALSLFSHFQLSAQTPPQAVILGDTAFCPGDSAQLFAVPGNYPRYFWSTGDTTPTIFAKTPGIYWVRIVDSTGRFGPVSSGQRVIRLTPPSQPMIMGNPDFCTNGNTTLTASPANLPKYRWSTQDSTASILVSQGITVSVIAIDANGCESVPSTPKTITENPLPLKPTVMGDSAICEGDSALVGILQPFYSTYAWSNGASTQSIWVTMGDSLTVSVVDSNGCQSPISALFIVRESMRPSPPAIGGDTIFCAGDSLQLSAPNNQSGYLWSTGDTTQRIWVKSSGTYALRVTNTAGCISPFSLPWRISALAVPATPVISPFLTDSLHANSPARSYIWLFNGQPLADSTEIISATQSGVYQVIALNGDCISDTSAAFSFVHTAIADDLEKEFAIYPNPASEQLFILFPQKREVQVVVMDLQGRKMREEVIQLDSAGLGEMGLHALPDGYYFLRIGEVWQKFLKK